MGFDAEALRGARNLVSEVERTLEVVEALVVSAEDHVRFGRRGEAVMKAEEVTDALKVHRGHPDKIDFVVQSLLEADGKAQGLLESLASDINDLKQSRERMDVAGDVLPVVLLAALVALAGDSEGLSRGLVCDIL